MLLFTLLIISGYAQVLEEKFAEWACRDVTYAEFVETGGGDYGMSAEEYYRVFHQRLFHLNKHKQGWKDELCSTHQRQLRMGTSHPRNAIDINGICPDQLDTLVVWPFAENDEDQEVIISAGMDILLDRSVTVGQLIIQNGGKLIFQDSGELIKLSAKSIEIKDDGEFWIGSRSCRYQGFADIELHGDVNAMAEEHAGRKFLLAHMNGVLELHGKEKHSWSKLNTHLYAENIPVNDFIIDQKNHIYNNLVFHIFTQEGDITELKRFSADTTNQTIIDFMVAHEEAGHLIFATTDGFFPIEHNFVEFFETRNIGLQNALQSAHTKYTQFAFFYSKDQAGQFTVLTPDALSIEGQMTVTPMETEVEITLGGMKSGAIFKIGIDYDFDSFDLMDSSDPYLRALEKDYLWPQNWKYRKNYNLKLEYTTSDSTELPIITLDDNISSWEVGDEIVVAATGWDPKHSEVFKITGTHLENCLECSQFQVKLNRTANHIHWGRIDEETGIDQRAEVGLLTRNVRFYGRLGQTCQYAKTRESLDSTCGNIDRDWCPYFNEHYGERDMHGAHMIFMKDFGNVHITHIELFHAGQPRLARYPIHWHHAQNVGTPAEHLGEGGYDDPSYVDSLSIHDCFSRFVTVHATHAATVKNVVGYKTHGHGFFIEDGNEVDNMFLNNLGIDIRPGIILPSDRSMELCLDARDAFDCTEPAGTNTCMLLSMFWISNQQNMIHGNHAVGGLMGFWVPAHRYCDETTGQTDHDISRSYSTAGPMLDADTGLHEWRNNKASACQVGFMYDATIKDPTCEVSAKYPTQPLGRDFDQENDVRSMTGGMQYGTGNGMMEIYITGWKFHHNYLRGTWIRNGHVVGRECQLRVSYIL